MSELVLSGDEAVARGALDAGVSGAFAYPGTPSTEIMEYFQALLEGQAEARGLRNARPAPADESASARSPMGQWCANEKTAYESALGVSYAGKRAMVSMKHVGLNVAADPFTNSALVRIKGGLVAVVADDPGMHSSQDEQDSRVFADFARIPCFEPSDQQEAYEMTRAAFDYSELHEVPVLLRITTRLAHARAPIEISPPRPQNALSKCDDPLSWILMPAMAKKRWEALLEKQSVFAADSESANALSLRDSSLGVVTCGLGLSYYLENEADWSAARGGKLPSHLHIGRYPIRGDSLKKLAAHVERLLVVEEGYPFIEREIRGIFGAPIPVAGKMTGEIPLAGELDPDSVRAALGLPQIRGQAQAGIAVPARPPQFCQGCPHADSIAALKAALSDEAEFFAASDIGCYTLSALPPWSAVDSCVDMGASVGMARGAATVGQKRSVAIIGDSTFYHSGMTNLLDAVAHNTPFTMLILDNYTTGMTGAQPTISTVERLPRLVEGLGVDPAHIRVLEAHRKYHETNVAAIREELAYPGVSAVILRRECIEYLKKARKP